MKRFARGVLILLALFVVPVASAQAPRGTVRGHVKDSSQGFLPGATVTAIASDGLRPYVTVTDSQGLYRLLDLVPGDYTVRAELANFTTFERTGVAVGTAEDLALDITLEVSTFADRADVFAAVPSGGYRATESVAATRIAIPLQDLPINVQVIPAEFLNDAVVLDIVDTMAYKAVNANRDIRYNSMFIRGFNNRILKRNGVRRDLNWGTANVESVEIVKGPASILYGEANPGGTVLYTTKRPVARNFVDSSFQAGGNGFLRGVVDTGARTSSDTLLFRLIGEGQRNDSYYDGAYVRRWLINPMVQWAATPRLVIDLEVEHTQHKEQQIAYIPKTTAAVLNGPSLTLDNLPTPTPFFHNEVTGLPGNTRLTEFFSWGKTVPKGYHAQSPDSIIDLTTDWIEATASYRLPRNLTFRTKLAYEDTRDDELEFGSNGNSDLLTGGLLVVADWRARDNRSRRFTGFSELTGQYSLGPVNSTFIAGYEHRRDRLDAPVFVPPATAISPVSGRLLPVRGSRVILPVEEVPLFRFANAPGAGQFTPRAATKLRRDTVYGFNQFALPGGKWLVLLGLRGERGENDPFSTGVKPQNRFDDLAMQLGAVHKFTPDVSAFVNYSESFLPVESVNPDGGTFSPETGLGYEVGLRSTAFDGRLASTLSVWDNQRDGILQRDDRRTFNDPINNPTNQTYLEQSGLWRARGFDAEVYVTLSSDLQVQGTVAWIPYAEIERNATRPASEGARLRYTPEVATSLWMKYALPLPSFPGVSVFGGVTYQSETEWDGTFDTAVATFAPWTNIDLGAGYRTTVNGRTVLFQVLGKNLTDNELTITYRPQQRRSVFVTMSFDLFQ